ncbi:MAG TPA: ATP synthase F1 subunit epsilon [Halomicronema sp.]
MSLILHLLTPAKVIWNGPIKELILPTKTGLVGILKSHVSMMTMVDIGLLKIRFENVWIPIYVNKGFASVEYDEITVLVSEAERGNNIDVKVAKSDFLRAEEKLSEAEKPGEKLLAAQNLKKSKYRLAAAVEFPPIVPANLPLEVTKLSAIKRSLEMLEKLE